MPSTCRTTKWFGGFRIVMSLGTLHQPVIEYECDWADKCGSWELVMDENCARSTLLLVNRRHDNWQYFGDSFRSHHPKTANCHQPVRYEPGSGWFRLWRVCPSAGCYCFFGWWVLLRRYHVRLVSEFTFYLCLIGSWPLGWALCEFWISLDVLLCTASILSLCAISIDRWVHQDVICTENSPSFEQSSAQNRWNSVTFLKDFHNSLCGKFLSSCRSTERINQTQRMRRKIWKLRKCHAFDLKLHPEKMKKRFLCFHLANEPKNEENLLLSLPRWLL